MLPSYRYLRTDPIWLITQKMLLLLLLSISLPFPSLQPASS
jgi:hypothetical protein